MKAVRGVHWAALTNLLVPGAGIVLLGDVWQGLVGGVAFALCANAALWLVLLIPDEFSGTTQALALGAAAGTYLGAQLRFAQTVRSRERAWQSGVRRGALWAARECLDRRDFAGALAALEPIRVAAARDLLVAYRVAQTLTGLKDADAALAAWRQVRALDRHHVYRDECREGEQAFSPAVQGRLPDNRERLL